MVDKIDMKIENCENNLNTDVCNYVLVVFHSSDAMHLHPYYVGWSTVNDKYYLYDSLKNATIFNDYKTIEKFIKFWFNSGTEFYVRLCKLDFNPTNVYIVKLEPFVICNVILNET